MSTDNSNSSRFHSPVDDPSSAYFLHPSEGPDLVLVSQPLTGDNYATWSRAFLVAITIKNKVGFIDGTVSIPDDSSPILKNAWIRNNNLVFSWIYNSISKEIQASTLFTTSAKEIWDELKTRFLQNNGPRMFQIRRELSNLAQNELTITQYYTKLKGLWDELSLFRPSCSCGKCTCGGIGNLCGYFENELVMNFLMGLTESFNNTRSQILIMDPIPSINKVFSILVVQEETQKSVSANQIQPGNIMTMAARFDQTKKKERPMCSYCNMQCHTVDDMEKLMQKYPNVSRVEFEKIRETSQFENRCLVWDVEYLNKKRENVKTNGRISVEARPLVQMLSVHVIPSDKLIDQDKPLTIYGRIYIEYHDTRNMIVHDLFSRKCDDAQVLGPSGGHLTLIGPDDPCCWPYDDCTPLNNNTRLVVDVFIGEGNKLFAEKQLCCEYEDMTIDMEKIELECVYGELCSLALHYIVMPIAVYAHLDVYFFYKQENRFFINVKGRIVARYGNVKGSECTLFEKEHDNEFERVEKEDPKCGIASMRLCRCWVGVPIYSSLFLDLDLSEFETGRKILKETLEFRVRSEVDNDKFIVDDDILILVSVGWASSSSQGRLRLMELDADDDDDDDESSGDDEHMDEASCVPVASSSSFFFRLKDPGCFAYSVEIFSVFIYREKYKPLQVYGSIQVASDECMFYVFKREAEDAFGLPEHSKTLPILDGPRLYDADYSLGMKIDLKDVESRWDIKGYVKWDLRYIDNGSTTNRQLCSVIQGQNGNFAAIHYTMFYEEGVYAIVGLLCIPKNGGHFRPKVHGSLVAQYNNYDYTTRYNKDYYRIVLFQRNRDDAAQPGTDGFIPLSRSVVAVLEKSSLIIEANIGDGLSDELSFRELEFKVCTMGTIERKLIMERNDYFIYIYVRWQ
ncbi:hypothetical protein CASFOL_020982 [Castilleja foliolosa]|uniref:Retrotransposon Copia-like N-terminal domain-containing protein n=1 Tax=Castilleja foliolosa TaxID=1961234 RepID=A0ABD3D2D6_9LAMI